MRRFFRVTIVAVACAATSAGEANAQDVRGDVAAGYSALSSSTGGLPLGWFVSAGGNVTENLGVAAEVSGNYRSVTSDPTGVTTSRPRTARVELHVPGVGFSTSRVTTSPSEPSTHTAIP